MMAVAPQQPHPMQALIYTSVAQPSLTDAELEVILLKSRTLNAMRGITGALLKRGPVIVQYLEGDAPALERTLAAIAGSPLHQELVVHARADDVARVFDRWHMGFCDLHSLHSRTVSTAEWQDVLAAVREASHANEPARRLLAEWEALAAD